MKLFVLTTCLALVAAAYFVTANRAPLPAKFYAIEKETAARPERFEALKYHSVDVRQPASTN